MEYLFTSESVCAGHPDKICDRISDAIVDAALSADQSARVAVETLVTRDWVALAGEVSTSEFLGYQQIVKRVISELGYTHSEWGFSDSSLIQVKIHEQSRDIARGVDDGGAGDQGLMFGYACNQTEILMPLPIMLAHGLTRQMDTLSTKNKLFRPDGKAQVTVHYKNRSPNRVQKVVLARPHDPTLSPAEVKEELYHAVVQPVLAQYGYEISLEDVVVNGTGSWEIGGPASDTGVTGRKIIADTYGGWARHGGGCFSGKDATKVDRSAAYATRWVAKNVVAAGLASECEIQVAYVIGSAEPVSVMIETFETETKPMKIIRDYVSHLTSFKVGEIIEKLDLRKPRYESMAAYGHFGRSGVSWERIVK